MCMEFIYISKTSYTNFQGFDDLQNIVMIQILFILITDKTKKEKNGVVLIVNVCFFSSTYVIGTYYH